MPLGLVFWILMLLWFVFGFVVYWPEQPTSRMSWAPFGGNLLLFILLFILGWQCFGFVIQK